MNLITPDFGLVFWQTVTLLVVLLILGKFAWKPILNAIREREENIEAALQAAEAAKAMVAQLQADQDALLKKAHTERTKIIEEAKATRQSIIEAARAEAENMRKEMLEQARVLLAKEQEAALEALKSTVATLSVQIAEKLLQNELQQHTQEKLMQRLIQEVRWAK